MTQMILDGLFVVFLILILSFIGTSVMFWALAKYSERRNEWNDKTWKDDE